MAKKVLVVDDEKLIVKGIRFSLEQEGMEVDCAYDGEEALEAIKNNEYDVVLLDVMIPKMSGFEVCQNVREFSEVPIIMLTAKGDDMDKILGLEYGADNRLNLSRFVFCCQWRIQQFLDVLDEYVLHLRMRMSFWFFYDEQIDVCHLSITPFHKDLTNDFNLEYHGNQVHISQSVMVFRQLGSCMFINNLGISFQKVLLL